MMSLPAVNNPELSPHIVAVALPVGTNQLFDYLIPEPLRAIIAPGQQLIVPLGPRALSGVAVELRTSSPFARLRPVTRIGDPQLSLSSEQLKFGAWIADYYMVPLGQVLASMTPVGKKSFKSRQLITPNAPELWCIGGPATELRAAWAELPAAGVLRGSLPVAVADALLASQMAAVKLTAKGGAGAKLVELLSLSPQHTPPAQFLDRYSGRRTLYEFLQTHPYSTTKAVIEQCQVSRALIATMCTHNYIERTTKRVLRSVELSAYPADDSAPKELTEEQEVVVAQVLAKQAAFAAFLLYGVTGSGKTEVYLAILAEVLASGKGAIVLVPEISLTPQTVTRFASRFPGQVAVWHSGLTEGERYDQWSLIRSGQARVVVGARSAIFTPVANLGLIVVDEEHDSSYKQGEVPRYQARDLAVVRAKMAGCPVVLGSATPSLESYENAQQGRYQLLKLTRRATGASLPTVQVVDRRGEAPKIFLTPLSLALQAELKSCLAAGKQAILFLNRRGFASFLLCRDCGHIPECPNCSVSLTYHRHQGALRCHYCAYWVRVPQHCPECHIGSLQQYGIGTEQVAKQVAELFPQARLLRMDADTINRKSDYARILSAFRRQEADILVGTQMIAKGHDFPAVTLVGVISVDATLSLPDFRAAERTFQLLAQVAGRSGRHQDPGRVIIQTLNPDHYTIKAVQSHNYELFYQPELSYRKELFYPPEKYLLLVAFRGGSVGIIEQVAKRFGSLADEVIRKEGLKVYCLGPAPAALERLRGVSRWNLLIKGHRRQDLKLLYQQTRAQILVQMPAWEKYLSVDVDPFDLL